MRRRILGVMTVMAGGCCVQFAGCDSEIIGEIVAQSVKSTAVEISTFVIESAVDEAFGLAE